MRPFRLHRRLIALVALASLFFGQAAVAMHACNTAVDAAMAVMDAAAAPCHHDDADAGGDAKHDNACRVHCQTAQTSVDKAKPAAFAPADVSSGFSRATLPPTRRDAPTLAAAPLLARAGPPPHSILHCCLRT